MQTGKGQDGDGPQVAAYAKPGSTLDQPTPGFACVLHCGAVEISALQVPKNGPDKLLGHDLCSSLEHLLSTMLKHCHQ
jgi:hypothetical protein